MAVAYRADRPTLVPLGGLLVRLQTGDEIEMTEDVARDLFLLVVGEGLSEVPCRTWA